jgi:heptaprenyl diphosphate synthase
VNPQAEAGLHLFDVVESEMQQVDTLLDHVVSDENPLVEQVAAYLRSAAGKRIRPALVLLSAAAVGADPGRSVPIAAAVELIHMATLVHDDIIDRATLRRGRPTLYRAFNEQVAVLAGDFLFARAFQLLADTRQPAVVRTAADVVHAMCVGEIQQNLERGQPPTEAQYFSRIEAKTATFLAASCRLGALAADAESATVEALGRYGWHIGMAFQLIDDLLDLTADPEVLGKEVAADFRQGVVTLPVMYALSHTRHPEELKAVLTGPETKTATKAITGLLEESGALHYVQERAQAMVVEAKAALAGLPPSPARDTLTLLADFVVARRF